jgi:hypothetical protein
MKGAKRKPMLVTFARTGERRYAVRVAVEGMPEREMNPAPGYDPIVPHDLQRYIVERGLGIDGAIYGGTVGTFRTITTSSEPRAASRERRKEGRRSSRLMSSHVEDCARSERATYVCWRDWLSHAQEPALRAKARTMNATAKSILQGMPHEERALYTAEKLSEIRSQFSTLSARWSKLKIGEAFTEPW